MTESFDICVDPGFFKKRMENSKDFFFLVFDNLKERCTYIAYIPPNSTELIK